MTEDLLPLIVVAPLAGGFAAPLVARSKMGDRMAKSLTLCVAIFTLFISIYLFFNSRDASYWVGGWRTPMGISLVVDGFARFMLFTVNLISAVVVLFSLGYMRRYTSPGLFFSLYMLMLAGMNGVIISGDLFNLFVFLEVASISSYALVAFGTRGEEVEAGFKYLILGSLGSLFILFGIGILYNQTSQLNMAAISIYLADSGMNRAVILALTFFLMGFGLKAAMVPFHAWLPDAHPSAPVPISAILSSVFVKALGIYALCRIFFNVLPGLSNSINVLLVISALSMLVGSALSTAQDDIKRLLAYCTIGQMGLIVSVLAVGLHAVVTTGDVDLARFALLGALFHLFNHAIFKSLLFLVSGSIEYRLHTRSLALLGGLKRIMPITSGCCRIGALSIAGIPPFSGFFSKVIVLIALFRSPFDWLGIIAVIETALTLIAFLKLQKLILEGEPKSLPTISIEPVPFSMRSSMIFLAILCLLVGPALPWLRSWFFDPAVRSLVEVVAGYTAHILGGGLS